MEKGGNIGCRGSVGIMYGATVTPTAAVAKPTPTIATVFCKARSRSACSVSV